jgi:hypothetical protein
MEVVTTRILGNQGRVEYSRLLGGCEEAFAGNEYSNVHGLVDKEYGKKASHGIATSRKDNNHIQIHYFEYTSNLVEI